MTMSLFALTIKLNHHSILHIKYNFHSKLTAPSTL